MNGDKPFVLFRDDLAGRSWQFDRPEEIVICRSTGDFPASVEKLETARRSGRWLAGFMSYEAGYLLEKKLAPLASAEYATPFLCFGIFSGPSEVEWNGQSPSAAAATAPLLTDATAGWTFEEYSERFDKVHGHIRKGDCYQANLTFPVHAQWQGDPRKAFEGLVARQPVRYGALVSLCDPVILSRSPELFFKVGQDGWIETHPMKGTARRGSTPGEDQALAHALRTDIKTQAENRMIVDLLRNDISRITETGTLEVPRLFEIETYPTVHQMISCVRARLRPDAGFGEIFAALFPCGSVTGAPKIRAMEILHELETGPRGAYCGAIGFAAPGGPMRFSVAIRTISLFENGNAVFNVGGGIVFDSGARAEYEEALLKARFAVGDTWISH